MPNPYFQFKQFTVRHDKCAMKVGTDGVLLGAWAPVQDVKRILDVGAGSGLISLQLAQRNPEAVITSVEIDPAAAAQAQENIQSSPWSNRMEVVCCDFRKYHPEDKFDLIVSNPPFSVPWEGDKNPLLINDIRFSPAGVLAPASKGDMAFIMHSLSWLASNGAAAIVCFPGIMYRGGAEQKIRKYLVDNNFVDAIIQLPSNLFLNVTISVDIMLLKKNKTDNAVLFVDAAKEFVKVTKNNRLSEDNIRRIVSAVAERKDEQHFARLVPNDEVGSKQNNYNLSVSTYVEQEDTREKIDIVKLNAEIAEIVAREQKLREEIDQIIAEISN